MLKVICNYATYSGVVALDSALGSEAPLSPSRGRPAADPAPTLEIKTTNRGLGISRLF